VHTPSALVLNCQRTRVRFALRCNSRHIVRCRVRPSNPEELSCWFDMDWMAFQCTQPSDLQRGNRAGAVLFMDRTSNSALVGHGSMYLVNWRSRVPCGGDPKLKLQHPRCGGAAYQYYYLICEINKYREGQTGLAISFHFLKHLDRTQVPSVAHRGECISHYVRSRPHLTFVSL